jgi:hypothetical protein
LLYGFLYSQSISKKAGARQYTLVGSFQDGPIDLSVESKIIRMEN